MRSRALAASVMCVVIAAVALPISGVPARSPLGPKRLHPMYIFGFSHSFVGVDTVTKKVRPLGVSVATPGHIKR